MSNVATGELGKLKADLCEQLEGLIWVYKARNKAFQTRPAAKSVLEFIYSSTLRLNNPYIVWIYLPANNVYCHSRESSSSNIDFYKQLEWIL